MSDNKKNNKTKANINSVKKKVNINSAKNKANINSAKNKANINSAKKKVNVDDIGGSMNNTKKYYCASCGYETDRKHRITDHLDSTLHMKKTNRFRNILEGTRNDNSVNHTNQSNNSNINNSFNTTDTTNINTDKTNIDLDEAIIDTNEANIYTDNANVDTNTTNINTNTTSVTNIKNNENTNVYLLPFGEGDSIKKILSELNKDFFTELFKEEVNHIATFIKQVYFDKNKPHNHVVYVGHEDVSKGYIYRTNFKNQDGWEPLDTKNISEILIENTIGFFKDAILENQASNILDQYMENKLTEYINTYEVPELIIDFNEEIVDTIEDNISILGKQIDEQLVNFSIVSNGPFKKNLSIDSPQKNLFDERFKGISTHKQFEKNSTNKHNDTNSTKSVLQKQYTDLIDTHKKTRTKIIELSDENNKIRDLNTNYCNDIKILRLRNENTLKDLNHVQEKNKLLETSVESLKVNIESGLLIIDTLCDEISKTSGSSQNILQIINAYRNSTKSFIKKKS